LTEKSDVLKSKLFKAKTSAEVESLLTSLGNSLSNCDLLDVSRDNLPLVHYCIMQDILSKRILDLILTDLLRDDNDGSEMIQSVLLKTINCSVDQNYIVKPGTKFTNIDSMLQKQFTNTSTHQIYSNAGMRKK
jgi:hypothetical protein